MSSPTTTASTTARARAIIQLNTAYWKSKVLQSAVELGLFELLAEQPASADAIRAKLGIRHRLGGEFLDALVDLGLLERDEAGDYRNARDAEDFLVTGSPWYLGGSIRQHARLHYHAWSRLSDALQDGRAKSEINADGAITFTEHYQDLDRARKLMAHMDALNGFIADELARRLEWGGYASFVDVGGARGNVAARLVGAHPHLRGAVFDLPVIKPLFDELMADLGTAGQVDYHGGDFFADPIPEADVLIIGHVLHDWPVAKRRELIARTFSSVRPGGALVIYDAMLDDERNPAGALLQSINCSIIRDGGSEYSVAECRDYVEAAGYRFDRVVEADTIANDRLLVAVRPR